MTKNLNTIEEAIEILQAMKEGKEIEVRINTYWYPANNDLPSFNKCKYRIKPEPREIWVNVYPDGDICSHQSRSDAVKWCGNPGKTVLFREVIEEE